MYLGMRKIFFGAISHSVISLFGAWVVCRGSQVTLGAARRPLRGRGGLRVAIIINQTNNMPDLDLDLTPMLRKKMAPYPRKRGRYNSSEMFGIMNGYVTPESWISPRERSPEEMLRMWNGILVHDHIQRFLPADTNEVKKEYNYKGITLVAKADNVPHNSDEVWEFKSSANALKKSTPAHDYQVRLYCSIFERQKGLVFQPVQNKKGLFLKRIGEVERDDKWFEEELAKLYDFHLKVEKLWEANKPM